MISELMVHLCSYQNRNSAAENPSDLSEIKGNHGVLCLKRKMVKYYRLIITALTNQ